MATQTIDAIIKGMWEVSSKKVENIATDINNNLRIVTPVDTGFARSNWHLSKNEPDEKVIGNKKNVIMLPVIPGALNFNLNTDKRIFVQNNVQYIQLLNDGWSRQAPAGYVESVIDLVFLSYGLMR